ncbi:MAG: 6-bladed beta-propeller [Gemmatimonadota bacterium]
MAIQILDANDTTLLVPRSLKVVGDRLFVKDDINQNIRAIDRHDGTLLWSYGVEGAGPGEVGNVAAFQVGQNGDVWILDSKNRKFLVLTADGQLASELSLSHLGLIPDAFVALSDSVLFPTAWPDRGWIWLSRSSLQVLSTERHPWPEPLSYDQNLRVSTYSGATTGRELWVVAFSLGPGFFIGDEGQVSPYQYVEHVPFAFKVSPQLRAAGADSARFAALSVSIVHGEIFMLFGGRPVRRVHPGEPTELIDVYDTRGAYQRSYGLPFDSWSMDTSDGQTFYFLTQADSLPALFGLKLRN